MTKNEYYTIQGYINILKSATPNGRHVHKIKNKLTGLIFHLETEMSLPDLYEYEVRKLIHEVFDNCQNNIQTNEQST